MEDGTARLLFDCYDDDIGVWGYVREQGEHCGARDIGSAGDFGLCSFGCVDNKVCGFIYGGRASGEICREQKAFRSPTETFGDRFSILNEIASLRSQ